MTDTPPTADQSSDAIRSSNVDGRSYSIAGDYAEGNIDKRQISTGGDYAEGSIDKRQYTTYEADQAHQIPAGLPMPFQDLDAFTLTKANFFFGRSRLIAECLQRWQTGGGRFLALLGASGSGKSSLAQAGMLPRLIERALEQQHALKPIIFRPDVHPLRSLCAALQSAPLPVSDDLHDRLCNDPLQLATVLEPLTRNGNSVVLLVDQFEELWTRCTDDAERRSFSDVIAHACSADPPIGVLLTLRSDFYGQCANLPALRELVSTSQVLVGTMTPDELHEAITAPVDQVARDGRPTFEGGLVEQIIADAGSDAGALPLLQYSLGRLWRMGELTLAAYRSFGGVQGAIQSRADEIYNAPDMTDEDRRAMQRLMLRLVDTSSGISITRRRVALGDLTPINETANQTAHLVQHLADARLLTVNNGMAEISHEALIKGWGRLQEWIRDNRQSLVIHNDLAIAAKRWNEAGQPLDAGYLLDGAPLAQAQAWAASRDDELTELEAQFLGVSGVFAQAEAEREIDLIRAAKDAAETAQHEAERAAHEAEARAQQSRRSVRIFAVLAAVLLIAVMFAITASIRSGRLATRAQNAEGTAVANREQAELFGLRYRTQQLAAESITASDDDAELSILLATEAVSLTLNLGQMPPDSVNDALHLALWKSRIVARLQGHHSAITTVAWSPAGNLLVSGSDDRTAIIWDVATHQPLHTLVGQTGSINRVAFSPDGSSIATASDDGTVYIWDAASGQRRLFLNVGASGITDLSYHPAGDRFATASAGGRILEWDAATGEQLGEYAGLAGQPTALAYSPDGRWLAAASTTGNISIWDAKSHEQQRTWIAHTATIHRIAWNSDSTRLASASADQTARIWNVEDGTEQATLIGHKLDVLDVAWAPDGTGLATVGADRTIRWWTAETGDEEIQLQLLNPGGSVDAIAFSPDGSQFASGSADSSVKIWLTFYNTELPSIGVHDAAVRSLDYSPDGTQLVTGSDDKTAIIWNTEDGTQITTLYEDAAIQAVGWSPDGTLIATGSAAGALKLWNAQTGDQVAQLLGHTRAINDLAWSPDGRILATASSDSSIKLWDVQQGINTQTLFSGDSRSLVDPSPTSVAFSPNGTLVLSAHADGRMRIWNVADGAIVATFNAPRNGERNLGITAAAWSPDGTKIVSIDTSQATIIWDVATQQPLQRFDNAYDTYDVAWGATGTSELVVVVGAADYVQVRSVDDLTQNYGLYGNLEDVYAVTFRPDGKVIAVGNQQGEVRQYLINLDDLLQLARTRVTRDLTDAERRRYLPEQVEQQSAGNGAAPSSGEQAPSPTRRPLHATPTP